MFNPESCDNICEGCEKNKNNWCIWKDAPISSTALNNVEISKPIIITFSDPWINDNLNIFYGLH